MPAFAPKDAIKEGRVLNTEEANPNKDFKTLPVYTGEPVGEKAEYQYRGASLAIELYRWAPDPRPDADVTYRLRFLLPKGFIDERSSQAVVLETSREEQAIALRNYAFAEARLIGPHLAIDSLISPETAHHLRDKDSVPKRPFPRVHAYKVGL